MFIMHDVPFLITFTFEKRIKLFKSLDAQKKDQISPNGCLRDLHFSTDYLRIDFYQNVHQCRFCRKLIDFFPASASEKISLWNLQCNWQMIFFVSKLSKNRSPVIDSVLMRAISMNKSGDSLRVKFTNPLILRERNSQIR